MTPGEAKTLQSIGSDWVSTFAAITNETAWLTAYAAIALQASLLLMRKQHRNYAVLILLLFLLAVVLWTLDLINFISEGKKTLIQNPEEAIDGKLDNALDFILHLAAVQDALEWSGLAWGCHHSSSRLEIESLPKDVDLIASVRITPGIARQIVLVTSLFSIYFLADNAGLAGLAITVSYSLPRDLGPSLKMSLSISLEMDLNAVERVVEYLGLPQELPAIIDSNRPPAYWPSNAQNDSLIVAENLTVKYAPELPAEGTVDSVSTAVIDKETTVSLDTRVSAGGANFSQGQRQLIAMARALLRRNSIVILDEATSSVDFEVQTTIREESTDSLLITVAHRLNTIIDYDKLLVLDKGKLAEFDTPLRLIEKEGGIFRHMSLAASVNVRAKAGGGDVPPLQHHPHPSRDAAHHNERYRTNAHPAHSRLTAPRRSMHRIPPRVHAASADAASCSTLVPGGALALALPVLSSLSIGSLPYALQVSVAGDSRGGSRVELRAAGGHQ
ncbi:hypothetical protein MSAN_01825900 [Mycena sanguinolenta]|uniref:ABC transporter domain-containing protein n=1 Tax=Mycena sanguinolenta TaxID=230812 RepID=A0A8H6XV59_9AGAR|nr:hypothetical protein MSAN_01825900 [Mycena sanguinolenta]